MKITQDKNTRKINRMTTTQREAEITKLVAEGHGLSMRVRQLRIVNAQKTLEEFNKADRLAHRERSA